MLVSFLSCVVQEEEEEVAVLRLFLDAAEMVGVVAVAAEAVEGVGVTMEEEEDVEAAVLTVSEFNGPVYFGFLCRGSCKGFLTIRVVVAIVVDDVAGTAEAAVLMKTDLNPADISYCRTKEGKMKY
jgi:hypothetical protein